MDQKDYEPLHVFAGIFALGTLAGLANLYRKRHRLDWTRIVAHSVTFGFLSLAIALITYDQWQGHLWQMVGVSLLAGLGGTNVLTLALDLSRAIVIAMVKAKTGLDVTLPTREDES